MPLITIQTASGGVIEFDMNKSPITGTNLWLHVDQSFNVKNGEGDAAILLTVQECKDTIVALHEFIKYMEGKDYVYAADSVTELISKPEIQEILKKIYPQEDTNKNGEMEVHEVIHKK